MWTCNFEKFAKGQFKNPGYSQSAYGIPLTKGIGSEMGMFSRKCGNGSFFISERARGSNSPFLPLSEMLCRYDS